MSEPRVGVGVIVRLRKKGNVFLRRAGTSHGNGQWSLPGGRLEFMETLEQCARREVLEEIGVNVTYIKLLGYISEDFFPEEQMHWITHYFLAYTDEEPRIMEPNKADAIQITDDSVEDLFVGSQGAFDWLNENDAW